MFHIVWLGLKASVVQFPDYVSAYVEFIPLVKVLRSWACGEELDDWREIPDSVPGIGRVD